MKGLEKSLVTMNCREILAPCGDLEKGLSAIKAGADALYLGMTNFSARTHAGNFTLEEFKELIIESHLRNVKVYVTLNTLLKNEEFESILDLAGDLARLNVDAFIVQDLGLIYLLKKYYPEIPLHASTQMNIHNLEGALFLEKLGFQRVILGRETTLSEMKRIKEYTNLEVEAFVHGALCVSQSGQCYISQQIGGRSGNRGNCAQICRKSYKLFNEKGEQMSSKRAFLSPKDLNLMDEIHYLKKWVDSFKIEGRMKSPEYVYSVVKTYKEELEGKRKDNSLLEETAHREFTKGLAFGDFGKDFGEEIRRKRGRPVGKIIERKNKRGVYFEKEVHDGDILTFETENGKNLPFTARKNFKKNTFFTDGHLYDGKLESPVLRVQSRKLLDELEKPLEKIPLDFEFKGALGEKPGLKITDGEISVSVLGEKPLEKAEKRGLDEKILKKQLERLGDTSFELKKLDVFIDENLFYPMSLLNDLRRKGISEFTKEKVFPKKIEKKEISLEFPIVEKVGEKEKMGDEVDLGDVFYSSKPENRPFYYKLPYFNTKSSYERILRELKENKDLKGFLCRNLGDLNFVKKNFPDKEIITDFTLNLWNTFSCKLLEGKIDSATLPIELTEEELLELSNTTEISLEGLVDDSIIVMTNRFCPFSLIHPHCNLNCDMCEYREGYLEDELGKRYPIKRRKNISEIYFYENYKIKNNELQNTLDRWRIGGAFE